MNALWNAPISDRFSSLCARVFSPAAAILESEKTLWTRLQKIQSKWRRVSFANCKITDVFPGSFLAESGKILPMGKRKELHYSVLQTPWASNVGINRCKRRVITVNSSGPGCSKLG